MMHAEIKALRPTLSRLEWNVIALAIREAGEARRETGGLIARALRSLRRLMGDASEPRPLGSTRLEALRRFVDVVRSGGVAHPALESELASFGYSPAQLAAVAQLSR